jgi:hypothetical protein
MLLTDTRLGNIARLQTKFLNTTNMCIELFFLTYSASDNDKSTVSIIAVSEENDEILLASSTGYEPRAWNRLFAVLPAGIYQVAIQGIRSSSGLSGLSIDDVVISSCSFFG